MKRELKVVISLLEIPPMASFKTDPDEKGTERLIYVSISILESLMFQD